MGVKKKSKNRCQLSVSAKAKDKNKNNGGQLVSWQEVQWKGLSGKWKEKIKDKSKRLKTVGRKNVKSRCQISEKN